VTTPHSSKLGASGMTPVCRPTPLVRFNHMSEPSLITQLMYWLAQPTIGALVLLPEGASPRNLQTRFGWKSAEELLINSFWTRQKWK
jgi:hypothetical protein